ISVARRVSWRDDVGQYTLSILVHGGLAFVVVGTYPRRIMGEIVLDRVSKEYSGGVVAVDDISLKIGDGEFIVLVGPSGCGKSTLLRLIAGLEEATQGTIAIGDVDVTTFAPRKRDIAMVFQSYALYPHLSVRQNIAYG